MKVLIVDDEVDICKRLQCELKREGCQVEYTTSPVDVLARLRNARTKGNPYEVLLLDLRMPKVGGFELLKEIREAGFDLDVVIITGYGDEDKAIEAVRLGAVDYLPKPISLDQLHTAIFRIRQKRAKEAKKALKHSILVVDDEKDLCDRIKHELDKEGYQTAVAYNGNEGLDYFKNKQVDVVIADIRMPRMSGLEMLECCRKITDDFVSIIITGHGDHETAIEALKVGVFNYLRKPVPLEELVVSVDKGIDLLLLRRGLSARRRELEIETAIKEQYANKLEKMVEERTKEIKKLSDAVKATTESIVLADLEGTITDVNEATLKMYGTDDKTDLIGTSSFELIAPEDREEAMAAMQEVIDKGYLKDQEYHVVTKDGIEVPVEMSVSIMRGVDGEPVGFVWVTRDITERVRAEETLRESEKKYRELVNTSIDGVISVDSQMRITLWNQGAERIFGYTEEEMLGQSLVKITPEKYRKAQENGFAGFGRSGLGPVIGKTLELRGLRRDGTEVPVELSVSSREVGRTYVATAIARDITERVRSEETLRLQFVNLAETVSRIFGLRNPYVATHQQGTAKLARAVGEKMGLDGDRLQSLYIGSLLHDIGKTAIPEGILRKPGELTEAEWGVVRTHPQRGYDVLREADLPPLVAELALQHHERLDGSGYPGGLKGDKLSLEVRILMVCNVVDAMSLRHPYRPARSKQEITEEIKKGKGTKYDPDVVDVLLEMIESGEAELKE